MKAIAFSALALLCLAAQSARADETDKQEREARALFPVVLAGEPAPKHCFYDDDWASDPIPESVARTYFRSSPHADLVPPTNIVAVKDIFDPRGMHPDWFCGYAERTKLQDETFAAFAKSQNRDVRVSSRSFTFPVFDAGYRRAIVIVSRKSLAQTRLDGAIGKRPAGSIMRHPGDYVGLARVYVKRKGRWRLLHSEVVGIS